MAVIVAPDMRLARQALRFAVGAAKECPSIARLIENETSDGFTIRRSDGRPVSVEVLPATSGGSALRGRSLVSAALDESAFFKSDSYAVNDQDIYRAVSPRVLPGGMVVVASTPWAEAGLLYDLFTKNWGEPRTAVAAHAPTLLMQDTPRNRETVERERDRDPENARRENDAEFISGGSSLYFGAELSSALERDMGIRTSAEPGTRVVIGGDIGLVRDATAFCAVHRIGDEITLAEVLELRPRKIGKGKTEPLKLKEVVPAGCAFAARHGSKIIHVDDHVLNPAREHLPEGFQLKRVAGGNEAKAERFRLLKEALRREVVHIPGALVRVVSQLADVVGQPGPGGIMLIKQPRRAGSHGDAAAAFVIAASSASDRVRGLTVLAAIGKNMQRERLAKLERAAGLR